MRVIAVFIASFTFEVDFDSNFLFELCVNWLRLVNFITDKVHIADWFVIWITFKVRWFFIYVVVITRIVHVWNNESNEFWMPNEFEMFQSVCCLSYYLQFAEFLWWKTTRKWFYEQQRNLLYLDAITRCERIIFVWFTWVSSINSCSISHKTI